MRKIAFPNRQHNECIKIMKFHLEHKTGGRRKGDRSKCCHHHSAISEVSLVLVFVSIGVLAEDWASCKPSPTQLEDQSGLGLDRDGARQGMSPEMIISCDWSDGSHVTEIL